MAITLYELSQAGMEMATLLESLDGELTPELEQELDMLLAAGVDRIESAAMVVKRLEAEADGVRGTAFSVSAEAQRLEQRAVAIENNADRLKSRMTHVLDHVFSGKVKTPLFTIWAQSSADTVGFEVAPEFTAEMLAKDDPDLVLHEYKLNRKRLTELHKSGDCLPDAIVVTERPGKRFCRIK